MTYLYIILAIIIIGIIFNLLFNLAHRLICIGPIKEFFYENKIEYIGIKKIHPDGSSVLTNINYVHFDVIGIDETGEKFNYYIMVEGLPLRKVSLIKKSVIK